MKRLLVPALAGAAMIGAVSALAASMTVSSSSLGSGNGSVASCNASATVSYAPPGAVYSQSGPYGYKIGIAPVASAASCASMTYRVTLTGASNAALAERTGTLDVNGEASPNFTADNIAAADVTGVSIVITG